MGWRKFSRLRHTATRTRQPFTWPSDTKRNARQRTDTAVRSTAWQDSGGGACWWERASQSNFSSDEAVRGPNFAIQDQQRRAIESDGRRGVYRANPWRCALAVARNCVESNLVWNWQGFSFTTVELLPAFVQRRERASRGWTFPRSTSTHAVRAGMGGGALVR